MNQSIKHILFYLIGALSLSSCMMSSNTLEVEGAALSPAISDLFAQDDSVLIEQITPASNIGNNQNPIFRISNVLTGATVKLFLDDNCKVEVASTTALTSTVDLSPSLISDGSYNFYVLQINSQNTTSKCSSSTVNYTLDTIAPASPTGIGFQIPATSPSSINRPTFSVTGVNNLFVVKLFTSPDCLSGEVASSTSSGTSINLQTSILAEGVHSIYASQIDLAGNSSICSTATISYDVNRPFVSIWRTSTPNETITLPLRDTFTYDFIVDWGDGSSSTITAFDDSEITHNYAIPNDYTITIGGVAQAWYFNNAGDKDKLIEVVELGEMNWTNLSRAFYGCTSLTSFSGGDTSAVVDMSFMFSGASALTTLDLSTFVTDSVLDMGYMFRDISSIMTLDVSSFNTSSVTLMTRMFQGMSSLTSLDLSTFNTSQVESMFQMFTDSSSITTLDLTGSFNTSSVNNMLGLFKNLSSLTSIDLSNFNTANVENMDGMFEGTSLITSLTFPISFTTPLVTRMATMFRNMSSLTSLDLSNFDTSNVNTMKGMFRGTTNLSSLNLTGMNTSKVTDMNYMFHSSTSLTSVDVSSFNTSKVESMFEMFYNTGLINLDLSNFDTAIVTNMGNMFNFSNDLLTLNATDWDISSVVISDDIFTNINASLAITCNQGSGFLFGETCL